jgi:uncharacterized UPF0160 family protein
MRVVTHPGNFHADDVFAVATLGLAEGALEIVRTRDPEAIAAAGARIDVGGKDDPRTGDYDHHQKGGAGARPNGIRYASFGLVWRRYGAQLAGGEEEAAAIDERLVQGVDANDTGQEITETLVDGIRPMSVSGVIAALNPSWDEDLSPEEEDARFADAVALATRILEREIAGGRAFARARSLVEAAIARATDPRVIELDGNMPWRELVTPRAPEALYVMYPKADGWGAQAVPVEPGAFGNRRDLPAEWAGHSGEELAAITGVPDAIFAHPARFYVSAGTREGIVALLEQALRG